MNIMVKSSCYKEYSKRNYIITNVSLQTKTAGQKVSYMTTHSAFIFPIEGMATISFDNKNFLARPGYMIHGAPGHQLTFEVLGEQPFGHLNIYYDADTIWDAKSDWMNTLYAMSIKDNQVAEKLLQGLIHNSQARNWDEFMQREIMAKQLILRLFSQSGSSDSDYQIVLASEYLRKNYNQHITLKDLANRFNMEESHLSYMFAKMFHIRPIDYLICIRLRKASELLAKGYSVNATAELVGYHDALYFSRLFKKHYGFAPSYLKSRIETGAGKESYVPENKSEFIIF